MHTVGVYNLTERDFTNLVTFLNDDFTHRMQLQTDVEFWTYKIKK
jgi:hypothetical protein